MNRLDHPAVQAWLARLDTEASVLPDDQRAALRADAEDLLAGALTGSAADDAAVARALAELGEPAEIVAETAGYVLPPVEAEGAPEDPAAAESGAPWLETATVALLAASVVLALIPATRVVAPLPWFLGTLMVLISRRWTAADKGIAVVMFGVLGVPLLLLGHDELPIGLSVIVSVALVAAWLAAAAWLLLRAGSPREQGRGLRMR
jgi:hypothetical protein